MTEPPTPRKKTYPRATAIVGGLIAGLAAGLIAYLLIGLAGFIIAFLIGAVTGSRAVLIARRQQAQQS
jgi:predicted lipid-binding transport protein (Tim44 family)